MRVSCSYVNLPPLTLAQNAGYEVKGVVVDKSGMPILGATVVEKGHDQRRLDGHRRRLCHPRRRPRIGHRSQLCRLQDRQPGGQFVAAGTPHARRGCHGHRRRGGDRLRFGQEERHDRFGRGNQGRRVQPRSRGLHAGHAQGQGSGRTHHPPATAAPDRAPPSACAVRLRSTPRTTR